MGLGFRVFRVSAVGLRDFIFSTPLAPQAAEKELQELLTALQLWLALNGLGFRVYCCVSVFFCGLYSKPQILSPLCLRNWLYR